jgi:hypothetical protein
MKGSSWRGDQSWSARANSSLPVPDSPRSKHRRMAARDAAHLVEHGLDRRRVSDDPRGRFRLGLLRRRALGDRFLEPALLVHEPFAVARNEPLQAHRLAQQVGNHREEPNVLIEAEVLAVAMLAIDRHGTDHGAAILDRNADEREIVVGRAPGRKIPILEQGILLHLPYHERHFGDDDASDGPLGQAIEVASRGRIAPAGADDHFRCALVVEQGDQAMLHVEEAREQLQHGRKRGFESRGDREQFRDLVDAHERDIGAAHVRYAPIAAGFFQRTVLHVPPEIDRGNPLPTLPKHLCKKRASAHGLRDRT